jgi:hypothetical protein
MTSKQMLDHAEECRVVSTYVLSEEIRRAYLELAITWERMARDKDAQPESASNVVGAA